MAERHTDTVFISFPWNFGKFHEDKTFETLKIPKKKVESENFPQLVGISEMF